MTSNLKLPTAQRPRIRWRGLAGAARALYLARAASEAQAPLLILARDAATAATLEEEIGFFAPPELPVLVFPGYETLPYDQFSPHPDITSHRLRALARMPTLRSGLVISDVQTAMQRLSPRSFIDGHALSLKTGDALDLESFRARLTTAGYISVPQVAEPGEFAIRGSLFDIFPMGSEAPLRIDLFDREIDTIRSFDPDTQRSSDVLDQLELLPAREFSLAPGSTRDFRRRFRTRFEGDLTRMPLYRDIGEGLAPAGIEYYLPLFFEETASLLEYLPDNGIVVCPEDLAADLSENWTGVEERFEERRYDIEHPVLAPPEIYLPPAEWLQRADSRFAILLSDGPSVPSRPSTPSVDFAATAAPVMRLDQRHEQSVRAFAEHLDASASRVLLAAESPGRRELLLDVLRPFGIGPKVFTGWQSFLDSGERLGIVVAPLATGTVLQDPAVTVFAEEQLFGERAKQERRRRRSDRDPAQIIQQLADLRPGAPVVHEDYGVGRYHGNSRDGGRVPGAGVRRRRPALCAGTGARANQSLYRRGAGVRPAAQARR